MTETIDTPAPSGDERPAGGKGGGLSAKLLPELKSIASGLGIKTAGLKKADLVSAIRAAQSGGGSAGGNAGSRPPAQRDGAADQQPQDRSGDQDTTQETRGRQEKGARRPKQDRREQDAQQDTQQDTQQDGSAKGDRGDKQQSDKRQGDKQQSDKQDQSDDQSTRGDQNKNNQQDNRQDNRQQDGQQGDDEDGGGSRRNRRRRGRDRQNNDRQGNQGGGGQNQGGGGGRGNREPDTQILEDDVLTPCGGILDVLDNYAFVRTSGYLAGADDVYVSLSMVRKLGLRRGDAVTGQVRQPREGERKEKFNPLVKVDSINGADPEQARNRVEFDKLTPLYPQDRLRLETTPDNLTGRVIDVVAPIGKGQRGLVLAPPRAGASMVLRSIATSVTANNPEAHLMVVLVDERPEEVTEFQRVVAGEVIASTFDRPAIDHTTAAELAVERAKRLVELGHDVVVLLDGITRLGRAYNLALAPTGRTLGGVDVAAVHPTKRLLGAARNVEDGGSLTVLATATVDTGSATDALILEEVRGTDNLELRLREDLAEQRIFPAADPVASSTRREELLMSEQELAIVWKLRRVLAKLEPQQALEQLLGGLRKSSTNYEFLTTVQRQTPDSE